MPSLLQQRYPTLKSVWARPDQAVRVTGRDGIVIADIPLSYLETSNSNTWDYVSYIIGLCVEEPGYLLSEDGQRVCGSAFPTAGKYSFWTGVCNVMLSLPFTVTPQGSLIVDRLGASRLPTWA